MMHFCLPIAFSTVVFLKYVCGVAPTIMWNIPEFYELQGVLVMYIAMECSKTFYVSCVNYTRLTYELSTKISIKFSLHFLLIFGLVTFWFFLHICQSEFCHIRKLRILRITSKIKFVFTRRCIFYSAQQFENALDLDA